MIIRRSVKSFRKVGWKALDRLGDIILCSVVLVTFLLGGYVALFRPFVWFLDFMDW